MSNCGQDSAILRPRRGHLAAPSQAIISFALGERCDQANLHKELSQLLFGRIRTVAGGGHLVNLCGRQTFINHKLQEFVLASYATWHWHFWCSNFVANFSGKLIIFIFWLLIYSVCRRIVNRCKYKDVFKSRWPNSSCHPSSEAIVSGSKQSWRQRRLMPLHPRFNCINSCGNLNKRHAKRMHLGRVSEVADIAWCSVHHLSFDLPVIKKPISWLLTLVCDLLLCGFKLFVPVFWDQPMSLWNWGHSKLLSLMSVCTKCYKLRVITT